MNIELRITKYESRASRIVTLQELSKSKEFARFFQVLVEVRWLDPKSIKKLNNTYRQKNEPTDILSFPLYSYRELHARNSLFLPRRQAGVIRNSHTKLPILLGSLVLCRSMIRQRAREEGISFEERLSWTINHGLKHLLGYDHDPRGENWYPRKILIENATAGILSVKQ